MDTIGWNILISIIILISMTNFVLLIIEHRKKRGDQTQTLWEDRFKALEAQVQLHYEAAQVLTNNVTIIQRQMITFWRGMAYSNARALHSPHDMMTDILIEKFQNNAHSDDDLRLFCQRLQVIDADEREEHWRRKIAHDTLLIIQVQTAMPQIVEEEG